MTSDGWLGDKNGLAYQLPVRNTPRFFANSNKWRISLNEKHTSCEFSIAFKQYK